MNKEEATTAAVLRLVKIAADYATEYQLDHELIVKSGTGSVHKRITLTVDIPKEGDDAQKGSRR